MKQSVKLFLAVLMLLSSVAFNFVAQASESSDETIVRILPVNSDDYDREDEDPGSDVDSDNEEDDNGDDSDGDAGDFDE